MRDTRRINYHGVANGSQRCERVLDFRVPLTELNTLCFVRQPIEDVSRLEDRHLAGVEVANA